MNDEELDREQNLKLDELLVKLRFMLKNARDKQLWGTIEIELRKGVPVLLNKKVSERLNEEVVSRIRTHTIVRATQNTEGSPRDPRNKSEEIY